MGSQGFKNIAGNPFVYQEDIRSAAIGLDLAATKWKICVKATAGALPTDTAQLSIDPAASGNIEIVPNGSGLIKLGSASYPKTVAIGDVLVASASNTVGVVTGGTTAGYVLMANGAGTAPTFQAPAASGIITLAGDSGTATGSTVTIAGGSNLTSSATAATVTIDLDNSPTVSGTMTALTLATSTAAAKISASGTTITCGGSDTNVGLTVTPKGTGALTLTTGNMSLTSGNLALPTTSSTVGQITINGTAVLHSYGSDNFFLGASGNFTTSGTGSNLGVGAQSFIHLGTGVRNIALGLNNQHNITDGSYNCSIGVSSLYTATSSVCNMAIGYSSLYKATTGNGNNVAIGTISGFNLLTGENNVMIGGTNNWPTVTTGTGTAYTTSESNNVLFSNTGVVGESNVIRIGTTGSGVCQQNKAYIAGTYGVTPGGTINIALVDSNGQLGSTATLSPSLGGKMTWTTATADATAAVNTGYLIKHATPATKLTITLPTTSALYSEIEIDGYTAGLWRLAQPASKVIHFGSIDTTVGTGGYLEATNKYDSVLIRCVVADTEWLVVRAQGTVIIV